jgi:hypothetical protein
MLTHNNRFQNINTLCVYITTQPAALQLALPRDTAEEVVTDAGK